MPPSDSEIATGAFCFIPREWGPEPHAGRRKARRGIVSAGGETLIHLRYRGGLAVNVVECLPGRNASQADGAKVAADAAGAGKPATAAHMSLVNLSPRQRR